jgi:transposase
VPSALPKATLCPSVELEVDRPHHVRGIGLDRRGQIAHRKHRGWAGGRPPVFDAEDYKDRNVIERGFNIVKQWRGLATRYDKLAHRLPRWRLPTRLRAITTWAAHLSDTP